MCAQEIEAKFLIHSPEQAEPILKVVRELGWQIAPQSARRVVDTYLDTADRRLSRACMACRVRHMDGRWWLTVKQQAAATGAMHDRQEWEQELNAEPTDPETLKRRPLGELLGPVVGDASLHVVVRVATQRRPFWLRTAGGSEVELVIDEVVGQAPDGGPACRFCELELELKQGDRDDLAALAAELQTRLHLEASVIPKLARVAGLLGRG